MAASSRYSRKVWERLARDEAYFAVLTEQKFRRRGLDQGARTAFFETGARDIESFLEMIEGYVGAPFRPGRALEYGCGVGRLLLPLARIADEVTGVDISGRMLEEASGNLREQGLENFRLFPADSAFGEMRDEYFDLILSYIVFQHIPPKEGLPILAKLMRRIDEGGIGLIHLMIGGGLGRLGRFLQGNFLGSRLLNILNGRKSGEPLIPMYRYPMNRVLEILYEGGAHVLHLQLTNHGGERGVILLFEKSGPGSSAELRD